MTRNRSRSKAADLTTCTCAGQMSLEELLDDEGRRQLAADDAPRGTD